MSTLDVTDGGECGSGDPEGDHRLLSVAEIQQVLQELRARGSRPVAAGIAAPSQRPQNGNSDQPDVEQTPVRPAQRPSKRGRGDTPAQDWGDTGWEGLAHRGDIAADLGRRAPRGFELEAGW